MGPSGQNVIIEVPGGPPIVTKDGVTVARSLDLRDRNMNLGAQIIKEAASRTCDDAGYGTITATVLTHANFYRRPFVSYQEIIAGQKSELECLGRWLL